MSLQGFINLRLVMIRAEYPKVCQYLQEEKQKHLEMLAIEGAVIFQRLNRNVARMIHMGKLLRKIYEELKEMCLKADVDMLQVRTKEGCWLQNTNPHGKHLHHLTLHPLWLPLFF